MSKTLIRGAKVLGGEPQDVLIDGETITQVGTGLSAEGAEVVEADGKVLLPGLVDLHTHLREPGREDSETVLTGTRAAASGGYTNVFAMANTFPVADTAGVVEQVWRLGREHGYCDVQPIGAVTVGLEGRKLAELGAMHESAAGVTVFSDDGKCVHDAVIMRRALEYVKAFDGVVAQHAQEPRLTEGAQMNEGVVSAELGLGGWPAVAEESVIARDVLLADHVGSRVHICHLSTAGSVEIVRWAKSAASASPPRSPRTTCSSPTSWCAPTTRSTRSTRRCAPSATCWPCARRSPTAPSTSSPPTTPRTRTRTRTASGPPRPWAWSAWRPRCRWSRRRWSTRACWTGPASPSACPSPPRASAAPRATAGPSRQVSPPTSPSSTRHTVDRWTRGLRLAQPQHALRGPRAAGPCHPHLAPGQGHARRREAHVTSLILLAAEKESAEVTDWAARIGWVVGLALFVALVYWLMREGWKWRGTLQSDLPELHSAPDDPGPATLTMSGRYHGSTTAGQWLDRIVAHGLGTRSRAELTLSDAGLDVVRPGAENFFVPADALREARLDKGIAGKVLTEGGLLVITWQHGDRLIDSGFRSDHAAEHTEWVDALTNMINKTEGAR